LVCVCCQRQSATSTCNGATQSFPQTIEAHTSTATSHTPTHTHTPHSCTHTQYSEYTSIVHSLFALQTGTLLLASEAHIYLILSPFPHPLPLFPSHHTFPSFSYLSFPPLRQITDFESGCLIAGDGQAFDPLFFFETRKAIAHEGRQTSNRNRVTIHSPGRCRLRVPSAQPWCCLLRFYS
jgi:hypothetical protein